MLTFSHLHPASPCLQFQFNTPLNTSLLLHLGFLGKIKYKHLSTKHVNLLYSLPQLCLAGGFTVNTVWAASFFQKRASDILKLALQALVSSLTREQEPNSGPL